MNVGADLKAFHQEMGQAFTLYLKSKRSEFRRCIMSKAERQMNKAFSSYLLKLRESSGLSIQQVAEITSISPAYISRVERGLRNCLTLPLLELFAKCYKRPALELISVALTGAENNAEKQPLLSTIIYSHSFILGVGEYGNKEVGKEVKDAIVSIVNFICECAWDAESKIKDALVLVEYVEKLKEVLN